MESKLGGVGEGAERRLGTCWDGRAHQRFGYAILSHVLHIHCIAHTHTLRVLRIRIQQMPQYCTYSSIAHTAKKAVLHLYPWILVHPCHARAGHVTLGTHR